MKALAAPGSAIWILIVGSASTGVLLVQYPSRPAAPAAAGEWRAPGHDDGMTRYSPLDQITRDNVSRLRPVWSFETGVPGPYEGNPLVVRTTLYLHTPYPNQVLALDLARPESPVRWRYAAPLPGARPGAPPPRAGAPPPPMPTGCCDLGSRGLAYHESGKLYVPILSGEIAALDARTGREIWRVRNSDWRTGATLSSAPLVARDLVLVGMSGAEHGVRGYLTAYDARNGRLVWRAWSTGPDRDVLLDGPANPVYASHRNRDLGVSTWTGTAWQWGGGTPSGWLSFDPTLDLVFSGTDQPSPSNPAVRPGDNKWTSSIIARELATGRVRWALQLTPHDQWGYGAANENILVDLTIAGAPVKALVHFDRNGFVYTIDRATGKLLTAERFGPVNWAGPFDLSGGVPVLDPRFGAPRGSGRTAGVCPAAIGMKYLQPAAYSPQTNLFFVPLNNLCMDLEILPGGRDVAVTAKAGPGGVRGRFVAWNAATAALVWENREPLAVAGGALATAGGLVFYGTLDGWLKALDQSTGRELWKYQTPSGIVGNPIAFLGPDGRQYVAVISGLGGWWGLGGNGAFPELAGTGSPTGVLTVFGL